MNNKKDIPDKDIIYDLYITKNLNPTSIENQLNISHYTFLKALKEYNIVKSKEHIKECREKTNLERYGFNNPSKSAEVKSKIGQANKLKSRETVKKSKETKLIRYGNKIIIT
jgi:hypothetical protein